MPGQNWKIARPPLLFPLLCGSSKNASGISRSCCVVAQPRRLLACHPWTATIHNTRSRGKGRVAVVVVGFPPRRVTLIDDHGRLYPGEMPTDRSNRTSHLVTTFYTPTFHFYLPLFFPPIPLFLQVSLFLIHMPHILLPVVPPFRLTTQF